MSYPETQLTTWREIQESLPKNRATVLSAILKSPKALFEIECELGWPVNRVSGRVTELRKAGLIIDSGRRHINPQSGKSAIVWKIATLEKEPRLF